MFLPVALMKASTPYFPEGFNHFRFFLLEAFAILFRFLLFFTTCLMPSLLGSGPILIPSKNSFGKKSLLYVSGPGEFTFTPFKKAAQPSLANLAWVAFEMVTSLVTWQ